MSDSSALDHPTSSVLLSDQPPFLTVQQASKLLHVSTWSLYQAIRSGEVPVIRWGRRVVLQREDLATLVASKRDDGVSDFTRAPRPRFGRPAPATVRAAGLATAHPRTAVALGGPEPA